MNRENTEKLFNDFPEFFDDRKKGLMVSLMGFGFECGDGWYDLIYNLCKDIKKWYMTHESRHYDEEYEKYETKKGIQPHFQVQQVKEKFGGLRFYISPAPQEIHDMIHIAEGRSYYICEMCGKSCLTSTPEDYKSFYRDELAWIQTLCDECLYEKMGDNKDYISDWQKEHNAPFVEEVV